MMTTINTRQKLFKATLAAAVATGTLVTVVPMQSNAAELAISDISHNQHKEAITNLLDREVVNGFPDGTFKPNQQVTRGQAAKIIAHILKLDTQHVKDPGFTDVPKNNQYYGAIAALVNEGIISGYEDKTFKPGNPLSRAQMAKILSISFNFEEEALTDRRFTDVKSTNWYAGFVQALLTNKITNGTTATTFSPEDYVTRGQLASFVIRSEKAVPQNNTELPSDKNENANLGSDIGSENNDSTTKTDDPTEDTNVVGNGKDNVTSPNQPSKDKDKNGDEDNKTTQAEIEEKYTSQLNEIEEFANTELDKLIDSAINEYEILRAKGQSIDVASFTSSYYSAASGIEASVDSSFYSTVQAMEAELAANGYSTESVKSITQSYESSKKSLKDSMLGTIIDRM